MRIGLVKEIKDKENRVALTPAGAGQLVAEGHHVSVEENAGVGSSFSNDEYLSAGAEIVSTIALTNKTMPYISKLAGSGIQSLRQDIGFAKGLNTHQGMITCQPVAIALAYETLYKSLNAIL